MLFDMMAGNTICPQLGDFQLKKVLVTFCTAASFLEVFTEHVSEMMCKWSNSVTEKL